jgi:6-phosphogluconolactonase
MIIDCGDPEGMAAAAADLFVALARQAIERRGRFLVALAGGKTPGRTYELLANLPRRQRVDWKNIFIFWTDERLVSPEDEHSNQGMARRLLLDHVPIPPTHIHPIRWSGQPEQDALLYEENLRSYQQSEHLHLDLILLGLGEDGHTASLFPGSSVLGESIRWVMPEKKTEEKFSRITLTLPIINQARTVTFLVSGKSKASTIEQVLDKKSKMLPATLIHPRSKNLFWLADREAISLLSPKIHQFSNANELLVRVSLDQGQ